MGERDQVPNGACKYSTDYLSEDQMRDALLSLAPALQSLLGESKLTAGYGCGAKIHGDLRYVPMSESTEYIQYLIEDSIEQRIILPGESDFYVEAPEKRLIVTFCHESDIHLDGTDEELLQRFMSTAPYCSFHWNTREEVE